MQTHALSTFSRSLCRNVRSSIQPFHHPVCSYRLIVVHKCHIPGPASVTPHELIISWWAFSLGISRQHTLDTHADGEHVVYWSPALILAEEIKADNTIGIDVGM